MAKPLPHLETFLQAAERMSFTAAARQLGVTQAAVSQRIQALEEEVGVPLFQRQKGRVLLTEAGHTLHEHATKILSLHDEARAAVRGCKPTVTGELLLASSSIPGDYLLPGLLIRFGQRFPHIQPRVTVSDSRQVLQEVEQGRAHLGLAGMKEDSAHLELFPFASDELVLVVSHLHPWRRRKQVTLGELRTQPLILREAGSGSRQCLEHALAAGGLSLQDFQVSLEMSSNEAIVRTVQQGAGATILSVQAVRREKEAHRLHSLHVSDFPLRRSFYVVRDRRRVLTIPARLFFDFLLEPTGKAS